MDEVQTGMVKPTVENMMKMIGNYGKTCRIVERREVLPILKDVKAHFEKHGYGHKGRCNCDQCESERGIISRIVEYKGRGMGKSKAVSDMNRREWEIARAANKGKDEGTELIGDMKVSLKGFCRDCVGNGECEKEKCDVPKLITRAEKYEKGE